jgi:ABC-type transport system involved in multi-copper enzyme maturation permease subunit
MFRLIGVEFFKLKRRWLPYILLIVLLLSVVLAIMGAYFSYQSWEDHSSDTQIIDGPDITIIAPGGGIPTAMIEMWKEQLVLPTSMEGVFRSIQGLGTFLVIILAASVVGTEYRWGTLRQMLIGTGRPRYLGAKVLALAIAAIAGVIIAVIVGFIIGIITTILVEGGVNWDFLSINYIGNLFASMGRTLLILGVYLTLAFFLTTLLRSSISGMAIGLVFIIAESAIIAIFSNSTGWLTDIAPYTIGYNVQELATLNLPDMRESTTPWWQSAGILLTYGLAFLAAAFYFFRRQDITA